MLRLLIKDVKIARYFWLPALFFYYLFISTFVAVNLMYLVVNMAIAFLLVLAVPIVEDKQGLDSFLCSLPVKRSQIVAARYAGAGLIIVVTLAVLLTAAPLAVAAFEVKGARLDVIQSPPWILLYVLSLVVLLALYLPLYFKLGLGKALLALAAACLGLIVFFGAAITLAARLTGTSPSSIFPLDADIGAVPFKPILPLAARLQDALGAAGFHALLLTVAAGMVALSLRLSVRFYSKREF